MADDEDPLRAFGDKMRGKGARESGKASDKASNRNYSPNGGQNGAGGQRERKTSSRNTDFGADERPGEQREAGVDDFEVELQPYTFREDKEIPRRDWIVRGLLLRKHLTTLLAPGGTGKSQFSLALALHVAAGRNFGPIKVMKPAKVAFLSLEEDDNEIDRRVNAAMAHYKISRADLDTRFQVIRFEPLRKLEPDKPVIAEMLPLLAKADRAGAIRPTPLLGKLHQELKEARIALTVIDPFVEVWEGDENLNMHMKTAAALLRAVGRDVDSAILLIHHVRKGHDDTRRSR